MQAFPGTTHHIMQSFDTGIYCIPDRGKMPERTQKMIPTIKILLGASYISGAGGHKDTAFL